MAGNDNLRVPIAIPVDTNADKAADSIASLRDRIEASKNAIRDAAKQMGDLKGKSAEVVAAKEQLQAKLNAERQALSAATAKLVQQGTSYEKVAEAAKKAADAQKQSGGALGRAISAVGGPVGSLKDKIERLKESFGGVSTSQLAFVAGSAALIAACAAIAAGVAYAAYQLGRFIVTAADAARTQRLLNAAAMNGNESWAKNLADQVGVLATKVPMARDQIAQIGVSLAKSRIGGQTMVDTLNAVAQASSALGDDAGRKLQSFVERGRQMQRFQINPQELVGTGVDFSDVAEALAKSMKVGTKEATAALYEGRVKLGDGAKALRDAVEKKVGGINLRQMMSIENLSKKAGEAFEGLAKDINLDPALAALKDVLSVFDQNTVTGKALKDTITRIGTSIVEAFTKGAPIAKAFIQGLIIGALKLENYYLRVRVALKDAFGGSDILKSVDVLTLALKTGEFAAMGVAVAFGVLTAAAAAAIAPFAAIAATFTVLPALSEEFGRRLRATFLDTDWAATGKALIDGLVNGIKGGFDRVKKAVGDLAGSVKDTFVSKMKIGSPSKVFEAYGGFTAEGFARGVDRGSDQAQDAVDSMVSTPKASSGARGGSVSVTFAPVITLQGNGGDVKQQLSDPALLGPLEALFVQVLQGAGIAVPA